jgi:hypothetical protein
MALSREGEKARGVPKAWVSPSDDDDDDDDNEDAEDEDEDLMVLDAP